MVGKLIGGEPAPLVLLQTHGLRVCSVCMVVGWGVSKGTHHLPPVVSALAGPGFVWVGSNRERKKVAPYMGAAGPSVPRSGGGGGPARGAPGGAPGSQEDLVGVWEGSEMGGRVVSLHPAVGGIGRFVGLGAEYPLGRWFAVVGGLKLGPRVGGFCWWLV